MLRKNTWVWFQEISFQIVWLLTVLGGNRFLAFAVGLLSIHYLFSPQRKKDLCLLPLAILGFSIDMTLMNFNVFEFSEKPYWLIVLWIAFILNFGHSLNFLQKFNVLSLMLLGAIGGCYAYWTSWKLGAVIWPNDTVITCTIIAGLWALILPVVVKIELRISQYFSKIPH